MSREQQAVLNPIPRAVSQGYGVPITPLIRAQDGDGELGPVTSKVRGSQSCGTGEPAIPVSRGSWGPMAQQKQGCDHHSLMGHKEGSPEPGVTGAHSRTRESQKNLGSCTKVANLGVMETVKPGGAGRSWGHICRQGNLRITHGHTCPIAV